MSEAAVRHMTLTTGTERGLRILDNMIAEDEENPPISNGAGRIPADHIRHGPAVYYIHTYTYI